MEHKIIDANDVVIRFAGDSGDGMQLTGTLFADMSAVYGNSLSTFPDYPAEIRAPKVSVALPLRIHTHTIRCPYRHTFFLIRSLSFRRMVAPDSFPAIAFDSPDTNIKSIKLSLSVKPGQSHS